MKIKSLNLLIFFSSLLCVLYGCYKDASKHNPINKTKSIPPQVFNVTYNSVPGGVMIRYSIPRNDELLYVKGAADLGNGVVLKNSSSYYKDSLGLNGFLDTIEHKVSLVTVSRSGKESEPYIFSVKALPTTIPDIIKSLSIEKAYGGISISYDNNIDNKDLSFNVLTAKNGEFKFAKNFYTNKIRDTFYLRGYDTTTRKFGVYVRDEFGNSFDTLSVVINPLYEYELDKSKFKVYNLPGDVWQGIPPYGSIDAIWDGVKGPDQYMFGSDEVGFPQTFTFDLGGKHKINRFVYYPPARGEFAFKNIPRHFMVWGSNNPSKNGNLDSSWILLRDCVMEKPSGLPEGLFNDQDVRYAEEGIEYLIKEDELPTVRYIRFQTLDAWEGLSIRIEELDFYGTN